MRGLLAHDLDDAAAISQALDKLQLRVHLQVGRSRNAKYVVLGNQDDTEHAGSPRHPTMMTRTLGQLKEQEAPRR